MFSYSNFEPLQSRTQVKFAESEWSKPLSFEAVGSAFAISMVKEKMGHPGEVQVGVHVQEGTGKYYRTKVVTFSPRFLIRNMLNEDIYYQQAATVAQTLLPSNSTVALVHLRLFENVAPHFCIRLANIHSEWSNPFQITDIGSIYIKLGRSDSNKEDLVRAEIALENATLFVSLYRQEARWPIRIDNLSNFDITIHQDGAKKMYLINKGDSLQYSWDFPSLTKKELVLSVYNQERKIDISKLGKLVPMKFKMVENKVGIIAIDLVAEGPSIVLKVSTFNQAKSKYRVDDKPHTTGFTIIEDPSAIFQVIQIRLEGIGISVISKKKEEIAYATVRGFVMILTDSEKDRQVNTSLQWLQIDNQMYGCIEPILLYPTVVSRFNDAEEQPILLMTTSQSKDTSYGVDYYHWFMVLLQELSLDIDEDFLYTAMEFFQFKSLAPEESKLYDQSSSILFPKSSETSEIMYFERLFLQPIQVNLSFAKLQRAKKDALR